MVQRALPFALALATAGLASAETSVSVRMQTSQHATAIVRGEPARPYALFARSSLAPDRLHRLDVGTLDAHGLATVGVDLPASLALAGHSFDIIAISLDAFGEREPSAPATVQCSAVPFEPFGADYMIGAAAVLAGTQLREQWADVGLHVRAEAFGSAPDLVVAFDSSSPTGGDDDLRTPGSGTGNAFAYGNLMILAENDIDLDGDGRVDDPDDSIFGGTLVYEWDSTVAVYGVTLVDIDEPAGAALVGLVDGVQVQYVPVPALDDNSVQTHYLDPLVPIDELRVELSGSGAVAEVQFAPCPVVLDFDTMTTGIPMGVGVGAVADAQWISQGISLTATTNDPAAPDAAVVFDTANPTGGDTDLVTPGYGIDNTVARRRVLVLADNLVDLDGDGLVDDPGDTAFGGTFRIDFSYCVRLGTGTVLDIDSAEPHCFFEAYDDAGVLLATFPLAEVGDNSIQTLDFGGLGGVRRLDLTFCHSGALVELTYCPDPDAGN